jgi:hypothetical protein
MNIKLDILLVLITGTLNGIVAQPLLFRISPGLIGIALSFTLLAGSMSINSYVLPGIFLTEALTL